MAEHAPPTLCEALRLPLKTCWASLSTGGCLAFLRQDPYFSHSAFSHRKVAKLLAADSGRFHIQHARQDRCNMHMRKIVVALFCTHCSANARVHIWACVEIQNGRVSSCFPFNTATTRPRVARKHNFASEIS